MSVSGKCFKCRVFNIADKDTERRRTLILRKIVHQWNDKEKADNAAVCVAICSGCIGTRMAKFFPFLSWDQIYVCSIHQHISAPSTSRWRNLKTQQSLVILDLCLSKPRGREITWLLWLHRFRKSPFPRCFPSKLNRKPGVFKFLRSDKCFRKAPFSWRVSVDGRFNRRNKDPFSNYSGVMWARPTTYVLAKNKL